MIRWALLAGLLCLLLPVQVLAQTVEQTGTYAPALTLSDRGWVIQNINTGINSATVGEWAQLIIEPFGTGSPIVQQAIPLRDVGGVWVGGPIDVRATLAAAGAPTMPYRVRVLVYHVDESAGQAAYTLDVDMTPILDVLRAQYVALIVCMMAALTAALRWR